MYSTQHLISDQGPTITGWFINTLCVCCNTRKPSGAILIDEFPDESFSDDPSRAVLFRAGGGRAWMCVWERACEASTHADGAVACRSRDPYPDSTRTVVLRERAAAHPPDDFRPAALAFSARAHRLVGPRAREYFNHYLTNH